MRPIARSLLALLSLAVPLAAVVPQDVAGAVDAGDVSALRSMGRHVLDVLPDLYRRGDRDRKVAVARAWYGLGWESEEAKQVLLPDLATHDPRLRLEVQWALGRVSADPQVVRRLLETMRDDPNPLFRDKAACALASDQIHLTDEQRLVELTGLVEALGDDEPQVRRIAIQALRILTGQDKGFRAGAPVGERRAAIERWRQWLDDYRAAL